MLSRLLPVALCSLVAACAATAALSPEETRIASWIDEHREEIARDLEEAVAINSATENFAGIRQLSDRWGEMLQDMGFEYRFAALPASTGRAGHLIAERRGSRGKRVLLIGHLDTVLPGGKVRREGNTLHGSGASDMKGGDLVMLYALRALHSAGALKDTQIVVVMTGDEEAPGHPVEVVRRDLIDAARRSDAALSFETGTPNRATIARRGIVTWELEVQGATGHSSSIFSGHLGSGAVYELARILDGFHTELRQMDGITCNPSLVVGGTEAALERTGGTVSGKTNIVAQRALARGDLRFLSAAQLAEAQERMRAVVAKHLPRTSAELKFINDGYPAMEALPGNLALLRDLDAVSRDLGLGEVTAFNPKERGAGDAAFVSGIVPVIDGIGIAGRGAHAPTETADLATMPDFVKRTAVLLHRLTR